MRGHFIQRKLCWADKDYTYFLNKFFIKNNLHWKPGTSSYFFICLTYAVVCLLLLEFSLWKKIFWHAPNSPVGPCLKNVIFNCINFFFASCWRVCSISNTIQYFQLFLEPFMASWPQNNIFISSSHILREWRRLVKPTWTKFLTNQVRSLKKARIK